MPPTPRFILALAGLASAAIFAAACAEALFAYRRGDWMVIGFEFCLMVAAVFGALTALGRFRTSHALALLCVGGTCIVASMLAFISTLTKIQGLGVGISGAGIKALAGGVARDWVTLVPLSAGALITFLAALILLLRRPAQSMAYLARAALAAAPLAALLWLARAVANANGQPTGVVGAVLSLPPFLQATLAFAGAIVGVFLFSIAAHCAIRALEVGRADAKPADSPAPAA